MSKINLIHLNSFFIVLSDIKSAFALGGRINKKTWLFCHVFKNIMLHILLTPAGVRNAFLFPVLGNGPAGDGYAAFCQLFTQKAVAVRLLFVFFLYDFPRTRLISAAVTDWVPLSLLLSWTATLREKKKFMGYTPQEH